MSEALLISVIVPARDAADILPACLKALQSQQGYELGRDYEIIVVDDGSRDDTAAVAQSCGAQVLSQANAGPAAARNAGARLAQGSLLAFTDADCIPQPEWLRCLVAPLLADAGVVGVKGAYCTAERRLTPRFVQAEYAYKYVRMAHQETIDFIDTYSAAYRRDVFLENGGFETLFPAPSVEDQEFSFRLARKGYRMVFAPGAVVSHRHDLTLGEYIRRKYGIGYWKAFMLRWLPEKLFHDSHTSPSQRWQILLLGAALAAAVPAIFWPAAGWAALAALLIFTVSGLPFLVFVARHDALLLLNALPMLAVRAAALGCGLLVGFLLPPRRMRPLHRSLTLPERTLKRGLDVVGGALGLLASLPVVLLAAAAIKIDSPGPAFYCQQRAGENGRPFRMIKLRTMVVGADRQVGEVLKQNHLSGPVFKVRDDPRVTRVGRWLRRWSLDELPQFWNVLKGEMSLVGPRPEEIWVVAQYEDHQRQRLVVKPGLTGPMQVNGRGELDMDARLALELEYIAQYSLGRDLKILWQTLSAVWDGKGAY